VGLVLLARAPVPASKLGKVHLIYEAFSLADADVQQALLEPVRRLRGFFGKRVQELSLRDLATDKSAHSFANWSETFCVIQWAEIKSCLGAWIANSKPEFGPDVAASFELANQLDRRRVAEALERREQYFRSLHDFLEPHDLLCIPTTPALAPRKGDAPARSSSGRGYYPRTSALTSVAGIGRLPQVSLPVAHVGAVPVGLSLLARHGQDNFLLEVAKRLDEESAFRAGEV
jgi:amidase